MMSNLKKKININLKNYNIYHWYWTIIGYNNINDNYKKIIYVLNNEIAISDGIIQNKVHKILKCFELLKNKKLNIIKKKKILTKFIKKKKYLEKKKNLIIETVNNEKSTETKGKRSLSDIVKTWKPKKKVEVDEKEKERAKKLKVVLEEFKEKLEIQKKREQHLTLKDVLVIRKKEADSHLAEIKKLLINQFLEEKKNKHYKNILVFIAKKKKYNWLKKKIVNFLYNITKLRYKRKKLLPTNSSNILLNSILSTLFIDKKVSNYYKEYLKTEKFDIYYKKKDYIKIKKPAKKKKSSILKKKNINIFKSLFKLSLIKIKLNLLLKSRFTIFTIIVTNKLNYLTDKLNFLWKTNYVYKNNKYIDLIKIIYNKKYYLKKKYSINKTIKLTNYLKSYLENKKKKINIVKRTKMFKYNSTPDYSYFLIPKYIDMWEKSNDFYTIHIWFWKFFALASVLNVKEIEIEYLNLLNEIIVKEFKSKYTKKPKSKDLNYEDNFFKKYLWNQYKNIKIVHKLEDNTNDYNVLNFFDTNNKYKSDIDLYEDIKNLINNYAKKRNINIETKRYPIIYKEIEKINIEKKNAVDSKITNLLYKSTELKKLINFIMKNGKKNKAVSIILNVLKTLKEYYSYSPIYSIKNIFYTMQKNLEYKEIQLKKKTKFQILKYSKKKKINYPYHVFFSELKNMHLTEYISYYSKIAYLLLLNIETKNNIWYNIYNEEIQKIIKKKKFINRNIKKKNMVKFKYQLIPNKHETLIYKKKY